MSGIELSIYDWNTSAQTTEPQVSHLALFRTTETMEGPDIFSLASTRGWTQNVPKKAISEIYGEMYH